MSAQPPYRPPTSPPPGYLPPRRPFPAAAAAAGVVVLLIVAGVAYWLGGRDSNGSTAAPTAAATSAGAPSASGAAPSATAAASASAAASDAPSASASAASVSAAPTSAAAPATVTSSATPSPSLTTVPPVNPVPDFGYLHSVVTAGGVTKLTFDRAILLTGAAAASYAKAHKTQLEEDYIIQNDNPLIRTWTVSPTAVVTGSIQLSGKVAETPSTIAALQAFIAAHGTNYLPVNLYYDKADTVTKIAEVYFP